MGTAQWITLFEQAFRAMDKKLGAAAEQLSGALDTG